LSSQLQLEREDERIHTYMQTYIHTYIHTYMHTGGKELSTPESFQCETLSAATYGWGRQKSWDERQIKYLKKKHATHYVRKAMFIKANICARKKWKFAICLKSFNVT
jgi:hypothetical protein